MCFQQAVFTSTMFGNFNINLFAHPKQGCPLLTVHTSMSVLPLFLPLSLSLSVKDDSWGCYGSMVADPPHKPMARAASSSAFSLSFVSRALSFRSKSSCTYPHQIERASLLFDFLAENSFPDYLASRLSPPQSRKPVPLSTSWLHNNSYQRLHPSEDIKPLCVHIHSRMDTAAAGGKFSGIPQDLTAVSRQIWDTATWPPNLLLQPTCQLPRVD
jgi:hypothetical protein